MKIINFLFFLSFSLSFSQEIIKGKIIDSNNKLELSYVNIGVANKNTGTVSDSLGNFIMKLNNVNSKDKITISHIGYKTKEFDVSNFLKKSIITIELEPNVTELAEVVVKFKTPKNKKLGRSGKGLGLMHHNFYSAYEEDVDDRLSKELGVKLNFNRNCKINALNFNITSNEFRSLKFRVNFYSIKKGFPKDLINSQDIIFEIKDGFLGWYQVDLKPYNIYLDKEMKEAAITLQWIESKKTKINSKFFSISTAMATDKKAFFRDKAMGKWFRSKAKPSLYLDAECN